MAKVRAPQGTRGQKRVQETMEQRAASRAVEQLEPQTAPTSGITAARPPLVGVRCLVVEDEPALANGAARMLKGWGCRPFVVGTLAEALGAVAKRRWDLLLVDLRLPDGDGETIVRAVKRLRPRPAVLVASGALDSASRIRLQLHGALVVDKVEFATHFLPLCLEALRRARSAKRRAGSASAREAEEEGARRAPLGVSDSHVGQPVDEVSARDAAMAEFGARFRFSPQEQQIFVLSLRGFSDKEIAGRLSIAHGTVRTNWVRMARKIGASGGERAVLKHYARWCAERTK